MNTDDLTDELISKYFSMLTEARQKKIIETQDVTLRRVLFCSEILARQCLSELCDAPEFSFSLLCNPNGRSVVGNFQCELSIVNCEKIVGCAVSHNPVGIGINKIEPFTFSDAQNKFTDSEIRMILSDSHYSFSEIVNLNECNETIPMQKYSIFSSLKDAYYYSSGRGLRSVTRNIFFSLIDNMIHCSDESAKVITSYIDRRQSVSVAVIERSKK